MLKYNIGSRVKNNLRFDKYVLSTIISIRNRDKNRVRLRDYYSNDPHEGLIEWNTTLDSSGISLIATNHKYNTKKSCVYLKN